MAALHSRKRKQLAMAVITDEDGHIDRISKLPEDLKLIIVSMLPAKDKVRVSTLSKTWKSLLISYLDVDITPPVTIPDVWAMNSLRILQEEEDRHEKRMIGCFCLSGIICKTDPERVRCEIDRWLKLVAKHRIKEMHVAFIVEWGHTSYRFPPCAFDHVGASLAVLSLRSCVLDKILIQNKDMKFNCLKKFMCCKVDLNGLLGEILSKCPALKEVILVQCTNYARSDIGQFKGKLTSFRVRRKEKDWQSWRQWHAFFI